MVIIHKRKRETATLKPVQHKRGFWGMREVITYQKSSIFAESIALVSVKLQILTLRSCP